MVEPDFEEIRQFSGRAGAARREGFEGFVIEIEGSDTDGAFADDGSMKDFAAGVLGAGEKVDQFGEFAIGEGVFGDDAFDGAEPDVDDRDADHVTDQEGFIFERRGDGSAGFEGAECFGSVAARGLLNGFPAHELAKTSEVG